jgi:hypothetical protein
MQKNRYVHQRAELCPQLRNVLAEPAGKSLVGVGNTDIEKFRTNGHWQVLSSYKYKCDK